MKTAIFFERDGVLNQVRVQNRHQLVPKTLQEFQINLGLKESLQELKRAGYLLFATTNQPGISKGEISRREIDYMHDQLRRTLMLDDVLLCAHDEADRCPCRKPSPGLFTEAAFKWHIDLDHSYVISDKWQDAQAAQVTGCTSLLIQSAWNGTGHHDFIVPDVAAAVGKIFQLQSAAVSPQRAASR